MRHAYRLPSLACLLALGCAQGSAPGVGDSGSGELVADARLGLDARRGDARPAPADAAFAMDAPVAIDAAQAIDARIVDAKPVPDAPTVPDARPLADADPCAGGGCTPTGVALTGLTATEQRGNTSGGTAYDDTCPKGQVLIGASGYLSASSGFHERIQGVCGAVFVAGTDPYVVAISAGTTLPLRGLNGSFSWSRTCSQNEAMVGFDGRTGLLVDQLTFRCAPLVLAKNGTMYTLSLGTVSTLAPAGGSGGDAFPRTDCPSGQVATTARIRAGDSIDAFGLACSTPTLTY